MTTFSDRLDLVAVAHAEWMQGMDHLVACEQQSLAVHELGWLCTMYYGGKLAHRALAGVLCAHRVSISLYDWMLVVDDDTVIRIGALDAALRGASPSTVPSMLGTRVDNQLNGSIDASTCPPPVPHVGGSSQHRHSIFNHSRVAACTSAVTRGIRHLPWGFAAEHHGAIGWVQRGAWAVGWPYGGHGIVVSRAGVEALAPVASECIMCLTCPFYGTYTSNVATHSGLAAMAAAADLNVTDLVRREAALGFGTCGEKAYDKGSHSCGGSYAGMQVWDEKRSRHRFSPDKHCNLLSMRCADTDVQLGLCFGRAGYAPQALVGRGGWSAHLRTVRDNRSAFEEATRQILAVG